MSKTILKKALDNTDSSMLLFHLLVEGGSAVAQW